MIMSDTPLVRKLGIKPEMSVLILSAPDGYADLIGTLPDGATISSTREGDEGYDFVQLFVRDRSEVDQSTPEAIEAVKLGGLLWLTYPKKTSGIRTDVSRDTGWETVFAAGWEPVTQIAIDETWSALRFRPRHEIKSRNR